MQRLGLLGGLLVALVMVSGGAAQAEWKPGCWVGVSAGMAASNTQTDLNSDGTWLPAGNLVGIDGLGASGGVIGVGVGCDARIDKFVVGIGADYQWHNAKFEASSGLLPGTLVSLDLDTQASVWGRAGILFTPSTLVYGLVGYTRLDTTDISVPIVPLTLGVPTFEGWMFGGGLETEIMPNVRLSAEYRYTRLDPQAIAIGSGSGISLNLQPDLHVAMGRLSYAFNLFGK